MSFVKIQIKNCEQVFSLLLMLVLTNNSTPFLSRKTGKKVSEIVRSYPATNYSYPTI